MPNESVNLNFSGWRRLPLVQQAEASECGLACLAMVAGWHGYDVDLATLRRRFSVSLKGMTLRDLIAAASEIGLAARPIRCEVGALGAVRKPCLLHWEFGHFVVLRRVRGDRAWVHDPAQGIRIMTIEALSASFTGVALELTPAESFETRRDRQTLRMRHLWRWNSETRSAILKTILLSLLIEFLGLLGPYYMQLVIDQAILKADLDLLGALALAFCLVAAFNAAAATFRSLVVQFSANVISFEMGARLLHHLLALPLDFFQKRKLGDLLQRFRSLEPIKQFIVSGGITTLVDGLLAGVTFTLMLLYSKGLALISLGIVLCYATIRALARTLARQYATDAMVADAREQSQFLETIRAIQTVKTNGAETSRETEWLNLYVSKLNASIRVGNLGISYTAASSILSSVSDVAILYLAARQVIRGEMTIGIITAFMAYKGQFMSRVMSLADQVITYRVLDVQLARVSDIALAEPEDVRGTIPDNERIRGALTLRDVTFRYAPAERPTLSQVNLHIQAGEFVAIAGDSGQGKTTLLKVLLGLYPRDSGDIIVDARPLSEWGLSALRRQVGVVLQEDQLLTGTIAENVALFDRPYDMSRIRKCGQQAQIDDEIMTLPMQYHTLVGDLGTSLSAGQRQRVLLARALYRNPTVLVLDECTAHVGVERERQIIDMLRGLRVTRVVVSHSSAMLSAATRTLWLQDGRLVAKPPVDLRLAQAAAESGLAAVNADR